MMTEDVLSPDVVALALEKLMAKFDGSTEDATAARIRIAVCPARSEKSYAVPNGTRRTVLRTADERRHGPRGAIGRHSECQPPNPHRDVTERPGFRKLAPIAQ